MLQQGQIPVNVMCAFVTRHAAGVSPAPAAAVNAAPALRRAAQPGQPGGFAVTLEIHGERKFSAAQPAQQGKRLRHNGHGISALKSGAIQRDDLVHLPETLQQRCILPGGEKGDFRAGEIFPDHVNGGQGEQNIADGFEANQQNVSGSIHVAVRLFTPLPMEKHRLAAPPVFLLDGLGHSGFNGDIRRA